MKWWQTGLIACLVVACLSPLASSSPDGLEKVAEDKGFIGWGQEAPFQVIADYVFPVMENEAMATILAGLIGTIILFGVVYSMAWLLKSRKEEPVK